MRIWKVKPGSDEFEADATGAESENEEAKWTAVSVADFDHHKSAVGRVEWNITGCVRSQSFPNHIIDFRRNRSLTTILM